MRLSRRFVPVIDETPCGVAEKHGEVWFRIVITPLKARGVVVDALPERLPPEPGRRSRRGVGRAAHRNPLLAADRYDAGERQNEAEALKILRAAFEPFGRVLADE